MVRVKAAFVLAGLMILGSLHGRARAAGSQAPAASFDQTVRLYNIRAGDLAALREAAGGQGMQLEEAKAGGELGAPAIVLWEARQSAEPSQEQIDALSEYVRTGGRLILTLSDSPGTGAFRFKLLSPTTAWRTLLGASSRGGAFPAVDAEEWDPGMFGESGGQSGSAALHLPYYFPLRPFDVAERGMQRYERFSRAGLPGEGAVEAGSPSFTRPLLNRDWQIRIRGNDVGQSGLLITGEYGAGRVAVFASSAASGNAALWGPLLKWLDADRPGAPIQSESKPAISITSAQADPQHHALVVELSNGGDQPVHVETIGRVMTWEHAMIGDVTVPLDIAAGSKATLSLALPSADSMQYQALDAEDAFIVRVGVLGDGGSALFAEQSVPVDFRPVARVTVALDNLRRVPDPFKDVPGANGQDRSTPGRMGEPVGAYAYPPGADVNVTATMANGQIDLAPQAKMTDETQPENPSIVALNDQVQPAGKTPIDGITAYGVWMGKEGVENSILFTFPRAVHVNDVVISTHPAEGRDAVHVPSEAIVEADGKTVADIKDFEAQVTAQCCLVHARFELTEATTLRVRFPWTNTVPDGRRRGAPWIGEIEIRGYAGEAPPAVSGKLTVNLSDAASSSQRVLLTQDVALQSGEEKTIALKIPADEITADASAARFFRVEAELAAAGTTTSSASTFMTIDPTNPLRPIGDIHPSDGPLLSFVVTHGFRNAFLIGTGTSEPGGSWETPDDLVWAYERQFLQTGPGERSSVNRLFVSEQNFSHYCAPWSVFANGEVFFDVAAPQFVEDEKKQKSWATSDIAQLGFGDRWDTGPAANLLYSWEELVAFDAFLRSQKLPPLVGRTRGDLSREVIEKYSNRFSAWHMARYAQSVKAMSDAFAAAGKKLIMSGQGMPLVPDQYQQAIASTIQGMSDDTTWGMSQEDVPGTTGRQMATLAFNPVWKMDEVLVWGYDSAVLNNPHWHAATGCTESSRRHYADPAWRGFVDPKGEYHLTCAYGFGMNAGTSWCMTLNDYQQAFDMQERLSLITPDAPLGAGLVIGNSSWNDPQHATFSGGGMGGSPADTIIDGVAKAFGTLCDLRIPVAFSTNVAALANWKANTPIIVLNVPELSAEEISILQGLHDRGMRIVGFGGGAISVDAAHLFGVTPDGGAAEAKAVGSVLGNPVMATGSTLLIEAPYGEISADDLSGVARAMREVLSADLQFPAGTSGYGFVRGKQKFVVVEDWREQGREVAIRLRAGAGASSATAVNVNDHLPVDVKRDGQDWVVSFATRPGDGTLLCVEER
jgi:hypothetical protein